MRNEEWETRKEYWEWIRKEYLEKNIVEKWEIRNEHWAWILRKEYLEKNIEKDCGDIWVRWEYFIPSCKI